VLTTRLVYCIIIQVAERYGNGKSPEALIGTGFAGSSKELEKRKKKLLDKLRSMR
jgi:hypothetical protein